MQGWGGVVFVMRQTERAVVARFPCQKTHTHISTYTHARTHARTHAYTEQYREGLRAEKDRYKIVTVQSIMKVIILYYVKHILSNDNTC